MVNTQTRRSVVRGAAGAAAVLLPACGAGGQGGDAGGGEASRSAAPVTVGFMHCGQQRADFYGGSLLQSFKARHPNVTLDFQTVECGTTYLDKMVALLVGGTPPDVWDTGQGAFAEYTKQNAALVLDPYIARDRSIDFPDFEPAAMYALDGKRHMLPYDTGVNVLYYNTEMWQRAGLPNPRQQWAAKRWDWAAFLDAATRLSGDDGGGRRYGLAYMGTAPWGIGPFLWQNGGDWADWTQNKQTIDRPPAVEALLFIADLAQKHRVMPTPAINASERPTFANGRVAMEMNFSFARANFMRMDGVRWDVAHLPTGKAGNAVHVARNGFAISRATRQPDASWQCLAYATGKEACTQATQAGTVHPPRKSIAGSDVFLKPAGVSADFRPFIESVPFGQFGAPHEKRGEIGTLLGRTLPAAFDGEKSAQAAAADVAPQLQSLLDQGKGFPDVKK
jgi:multiple sugar transport system substrate-binding protein